MTSVLIDGRPVWQSGLGSRDAVMRLERGTDGPASWRWRTRDGRTRRLPGYDALDAEWAQVPALPGVDVRYCVTEVGHLLGDLTVRFEVVGGRPAAVEVGGRRLRHGVDVWFEFPAIRRLERWVGVRSVVGLLAPPADLGGELDAAMLLAGLVDDGWAAAYGLHPDDLADALAVYRALEGASLPGCSG
jgi:hypothetical protein